MLTDSQQLKNNDPLLSEAKTSIDAPLGLAQLARHRLAAVAVNGYGAAPRAVGAGPAELRGLPPDRPFPELREAWCVGELFRGGSDLHPGERTVLSSNIGHPIHSCRPESAVAPAPGPP